MDLGGEGGDGDCSSFSMLLRDLSLAKLDCSDIESDMTALLSLKRRASEIADGVHW